MMEQMFTIPSYTGGDQGFLNVYFKDIINAPIFEPLHSGRDVVSGAFAGRPQGGEETRPERVRARRGWEWNTRAEEEGGEGLAGLGDGGPRRANNGGGEGRRAEGW